MRNGHIPRLSRSCAAPMGGQDDGCWSCGAAWDYRLAKPAPPRVVRDAEPERIDSDSRPLVAGTPTAA
jgi:hypothetical protein